MAFAVGACSNPGASSSGSDGGAGHGPGGGSAGMRGSGGIGQGGGGASGGGSGGGGQAGGGASGGNGAAGNGGAGGSAGAAGHGAAGGAGGQAGGGAGAGGGGAGGAGAGGGGASGAGAGGGGAGGQTAHLVTFAFTGHVIGLLDAVDATNDTTPRIGDPFTGSYTVDINAAPAAGSTDTSGSFAEVAPTIAATLEIHTLSFALPDPVPNTTSYIVIGISPTKYAVTLGYFGVPAALGTEAHLDVYWTLTNPTGPVPSAKMLSAVPPVLSSWTQGPTAVSIELKGTLRSDYDADGVIDTIVAQ
jgi:hypothetical protein